jgi:hypothetical protein
MADKFPRLRPVSAPQAHRPTNSSRRTMTTWWARATCTRCRVESAARLHHAVGCVGESGDEFSGAESFQGAEGLSHEICNTKAGTRPILIFAPAPSYTLNVDRPSRFLNVGLTRTSATIEQARIQPRHLQFRAHPERLKMGLSYDSCLSYRSFPNI